VQVVEEVHEEVARRSLPRCSKQSSMTEAVRDQDWQAEKLQERDEQIVMEKVAEAVQKKVEEG
jgi:hypothetical protein